MRCTGLPTENGTVRYRAARQDVSSSVQKPAARFPLFPGNVPECYQIPSGSVVSSIHLFQDLWPIVLRHVPSSLAVAILFPGKRHVVRTPATKFSQQTRRGSQPRGVRTPVCHLEKEQARDRGAAISARCLLRALRATQSDQFTPILPGIVPAGDLHLKAKQS